MTPELIAIIAVGVAVVSLILRQGARSDKRFEKVDKRFDKVDERFKNLEGRMTQIVKQQAKLEGPLEGLREAATCNRAA